MDEVLVFSKSLQERLQEYLEILSSPNQLRLNEIKREWCFHLEFYLDSSGWQAIWKIPRLTCEKLKIVFPTIVLVYVDEVIFDELAAIVKVIAVQDDISILSEHLVPLVQLWPTKDQDKTIVLNISNTASALDSFRFFYMHVFLPWDYEDDDCVDWLKKHLESRLRLFYDMKNGVIPHATADHISSLLSNARKIQARREQIESELSEKQIDENADHPQVQLLMDLNVQLLEIKYEVELLENPLSRNVIMKRQEEQTIETSAVAQYYLIYKEGKLDDYFELLSEVKKLHPDETFKFSPALSSVLESGNPHDTFILNNPQNVIKNAGCLEKGGHLKGLRNRCTITSQKEDVMLDFSGNVVSLQNLTIDAKNSQCAIVVRTGCTILQNVELIGDGESSTHQGIIVLEGARLDLIDCEIRGFSTGLIGNTGSTINIQNTKIHTVNFGIKIFDRCTLNATRCNLSDCSEYGFCVETNRDGDQRQIGDFEVLQIVPDVKIVEVDGKNNNKGDVLINPKRKISPLIDLFGNPNFDPTRRFMTGLDAQDLMDLEEVTVIEIPEAGTGEILNARD